MLLTRSGMEVVASVGDGAQALDAAQRTDPDVIVLDVRMPDLSGVDALAQLRQRGDRRGVVVLATEVDDQELLALLRSQVDAVLFKTCADAELVETVRSVAEGKSIFERSLLHRARELANEHAPVPRKPDLSRREREILELIRQGLKNEEIAERLGIKVGSAKIHVHNILTKTGAKSRRDLQ